MADKEPQSAKRKTIKLEDKYVYLSFSKNGKHLLISIAVIITILLNNDKYYDADDLRFMFLLFGLSGFVTFFVIYFAELHIVDFETHPEETRGNLPPSNPILRFFLFVSNDGIFIAMGLFLMAVGLAVIKFDTNYQLPY